MWRGVEIDGCPPYKRGSEAPGDADEEESEGPIEDGWGRGWVVLDDCRRGGSRIAHSCGAYGRGVGKSSGGSCFERGSRLIFFAF